MLWFSLVIRQIASHQVLVATSSELNLVTRAGRICKLLATSVSQFRAL